MNEQINMTRALEEYRKTHLANTSAAAQRAMADSSGIDIQVKTDSEGLSASAAAPEASAFAKASADSSSSATATADEMADREEVTLRHQTAVDRYVEATLGWQADLDVEHK